MSELHTDSNRPTSASNPGTVNSKNNGKAATPDPQKQRTTRSAPDAAKIFLTKTKSELYALSTSASKWQDWRMTDCTSDLYAKGFLPQMQGMSPSFSMLSHAVLRIAVARPPNAAIAADALRAVAVVMDMKRVDRAMEGMSEKVEEILTAVRALTAPDETSDELAGNMQAAAVHLTRTVDEQATALTTLAERLEEELQSVAQRVQTRADVEDVPISIQDPSATLGPAAGVLKSHAIATAQVLPPVPAAALANAAARARQILIEKTPGLTQWMHGMDRKALVDRAHHTTTLMSDGALRTTLIGRVPKHA
ncbi:hypothetical protein DFH08DRAFT_956185 [Mycena albidolilacea]|uniref:Uncharacterized protein n=1 Tax=Mycena albidolilacea TaxID=1033008 RepID=A0AAD7EWH2_9AGAR|nr:hypothetical protein DFH08DRAFT_956185 [Mycena albidolilacea]